jgi:hypothetical protein
VIYLNSAGVRPNPVALRLLGIGRRYIPPLDSTGPFEEYLVFRHFSGCGVTPDQSISKIDGIRGIRRKYITSE